MQVRESETLKRVFKQVLELGNLINQGTARGGARAFKLDSLSKLGDVRAVNNKMTLMHYLGKVRFTLFIWLSSQLHFIVAGIAYDH
jgi:hypothetical protein